MSSLVLLYPTIVVPILSEWVQIDDLYCLDSAVCNHDSRDGFLRTLEKCTTKLDEKYLYYRHEFYKWIALRGLSLKDVHFDNSDSTHSILKRTIHLNSLSSQVTQELLNMVLSIELSVRSLTINEFGRTCSDTLLLKILTACKGVEILNLSHCNLTESSTYAEIVKCCPNLARFHAPSNVVDADLSCFLAANVSVLVDVVQRGEERFHHTKVLTQHG